jgi:hypothetical protein
MASHGHSYPRLPLASFPSHAFSNKEYYHPDCLHKVPSLKGVAASHFHWLLSSHSSEIINSGLYIYIYSAGNTVSGRVYSDALSKF